MAVDVDDDDDDDGITKEKKASVGEAR